MPPRRNRGRSRANDEEIPQLRVTGEKASAMLQKRISEGQGLLGVVMPDEATLKDTNARYSTWCEYNLTMLGRLFSTDKLVEEYRGIRIGTFADVPFPKRVQNL